VTGTACGVGVVGSGWVARPGLVVTAAHVVAGQRDTAVEVPGRDERLDATTVAYDPRNDVAVLRVRDLSARPLSLVDPLPGEAVAILGYPNDGPFTATAGRIGRTARVISEDAYGDGPVARTITSVRGVVRHGNSGGPAVDARGRVVSTVFAAHPDGEVGYGVPAPIVRRGLTEATGPVSTGDCAR
jgi:S1-C subfamily serine protease